MRIVVTGKTGQVAHALRAAGEAAGAEVLCIGRPEIDLSQPLTLEAPIRALRPDVIVSVAAYTAVDKAEDEAQLAQVVNGDAPGALARIAAELNIPILHLSTDYVFAGDKAGVYVETDATGPLNVYGRTKLSGEQQVARATANHVILRTSWVYAPYGRNFVTTMLGLADTRDEVRVVADQQGCPTYAPEIANALLTVARRVARDGSPELRGVFHLTGQGETSWAGFAEAIFAGSVARGGKAVTVHPIATADYPTAARRPSNSRLSGEKLSKIYDLRLNPWHVSLQDCLTRLRGAPEHKI